MLELDGKPVAIRSGDTIASALFRSGVRTFSRSFKYHRRRGLYCLSGDCPNCLVTVDGEPGVRACMTPAIPGQRVRRERGWPSVDRDLLALLWRLDPLLPVGFYYKTFIHPRRAWRTIEPLIRRAAGIGSVRVGAPVERREARHLHPDLLVVGGSVAGLSAGLAAARDGQTVVVADEWLVGQRLPHGSTRTLVDELADEARAAPGLTLLERAAAIGIYEGPLVPLVGEQLTTLVRPRRVVVATGALEEHGVFAGNDLPGVWLGRGAAGLAGANGVRPGTRAVVAGATSETIDHVRVLREAGLQIAAALVPDALAARLPGDVRAIANGSVVAASGRTGVRRVSVRAPSGSETIACDTVVLSLALAPRDGLLRQGAGLPVVGAGDVVSPGCSLEEAVESGRAAALDGSVTARAAPLPEPPGAGILCLCEDVTVESLEHAWTEGFRSTELLKRYATVTMGPCQGALCHRHLRSFVAARAERPDAAAATTARPPARPIRLVDAAAGVDLQIDLRTSLHDRHLELGATMEWIGDWQRPERYGDVADEYWAVRLGVSIMDVGTLGKFLVGGPDATELLERVYPCRVGDIPAGRSRYALLLNESGFIVDDGLICHLGSGRYYCTLTTGGAEHGEAWLRAWTQEWGLRANVVNRTFALGAINVAGPRAREALERLCDESLDNESLPFMHHREVEVAGVPCRLIRLGFVGELSYELHHPGSRSEALWDALLGIDELAVVPHGLEALRLLRLEKGHILVGQDTDFDTTPAKAGLDFAVAMDKEYFVGKRELERLRAIPLDRRLVQLAFDGGEAPLEGTPLIVAGRVAGHITSARFSPALEQGIALAWLRRTQDGFPSSVEAGGRAGKVVPGPFYDPEGVKLRA